MISTEVINVDQEKIGTRIIETPADVGRFVNRDARVRFTAYVPSGSVAAGRGFRQAVGRDLLSLCLRDEVALLLILCTPRQQRQTI